MDGPGKKTTPRRQPRNGHVQVSWFHPAAYTTAMELAARDRLRVHVASDGSGAVVVSNNRRRPKWMDNG
jgi:hypothetical protein